MKQFLYLLIISFFVYLFSKFYQIKNDRNIFISNVFVKYIGFENRFAIDSIVTRNNVFLQEENPVYLIIDLEKRNKVNKTGILYYSNNNQYKCVGWPIMTDFGYKLGGEDYTLEKEQMGLKHFITNKISFTIVTNKNKLVKAKMDKNTKINLKGYSSWSKYPPMPPNDRIE